MNLQGHVPDEAQRDGAPTTPIGHQRPFDIDIIATTSLGDRSYLASDGRVGVVIDPQRDIDRVLDIAAARGVRITHVAETHLHNDYLTGGLALAEATGAEYLVSAAERVRFERTGVSEGEVIACGAMQLHVLHTPGHTHNHLAYALADPDGTVQAVFTGGSMLFGSTGRTDLLGVDNTDALTRKQYRSVHRLAGDLPAGAQVLPTHGFGSFCSATPTTGDASTIAEQIPSNPALTLSEDAFVAETLAGLDAYPAYYSRMASANANGPTAADLSMPELVGIAEAQARIAAGRWVVDLRARRAFAVGHLPGSLSFELADPFATYLGWLYTWDTRLTLISDSTGQLLDARRELSRIGIERLDGTRLVDDAALTASWRVASFTDLAIAQRGQHVHVLDTRLRGERDRAAIPGTQHIALHELPQRLAEVPAGEVWVHCGSGYRAAIAASLLDDGTRAIVHVDDDFGAAVDLGLTRSSPARP